MPGLLAVIYTQIWRPPDVCNRSARTIVPEQRQPRRLRIAVRGEWIEYYQSLVSTALVFKPTTNRQVRA